MPSPANQIPTQILSPWAETTDLLVTSVRPTSADATETITPADAGGYNAYPGTLAEHRPSNGVFQIQNTVFTFSNQVLTFDPKPRDRLTWEGNVYTAKSVTPAPYLQFWKVEAFRLIADPDLCDTIAVLRPYSTPAADGLLVRTLTTLPGYGAVLGRVQPQGWNEDRDGDGRLIRRQRFAAYLSVAVPLRAGDVVQVLGVKYEVVAQSDIDDFMTFTRADCTRID